MKTSFCEQTLDFKINISRCTFEQLKKWSAKIVEVGVFKTQIEVPISSRLKQTFNLEGKKESSGGLKTYVYKPNIKSFSVSMSIRAIRICVLEKVFR